MRQTISTFLAALALSLVATTASAQPGDISELSAVGNDAPRCNHNVPAEVCTRCNPELEEQFREVGDWCRGHNIPESQCHRCHPDLSFDPLPELAETADARDLTEAEALAGLETQLVDGKATVMFFTASWCARCRNVEGRLRTWLGNEPERLAVRRIQLDAWEGPLVDTYMSRVRGLPYVVVFDPAGNQVDAIATYELDELDALLAQALGETSEE